MQEQSNKFVSNHLLRENNTLTSHLQSACHTVQHCLLNLLLSCCILLQVDASPDRPAPGELREKSTPAPNKSGGTSIEGMIMGGNENSYLRRGATFDVMKNVEAGVEDAGDLEILACVGDPRGAVCTSWVGIPVLRVWLLSPAQHSNCCSSSV